MTIFMTITYTCHNSRYGHFPILAVMSYICYGQKYCCYGCLFKIQKRCRSTEKTVSKNVKLAKSYGKFIAKMMAVSFVF